MWEFVLLLYAVLAVRVFKKSAPNGKTTVYLGKRDFVDHLQDRVEPVDGVVVVDSDYLSSGKKVFGQVVTTFRYGREEDEVMGLKFSRDMYLVHEQIYPLLQPKRTRSDLQDKLVNKLGSDAIPFRFCLPANAPTSVTLQPGEMDFGKPLGVEYTLKVYVGDNLEDKPHRRSSVSMAIRKVQFAPPFASGLMPIAVITRGFTLSAGKIQLEVVLEKDLFFHGETVIANVTVTNNSRKTVRTVKAAVVQLCELLMVRAHYHKEVDAVEAKDGCPIGPGGTFAKVFQLAPLAITNKDKRGVALDGRIKDADATLASSTLLPEGKSAADAVGIFVSYTVRVRLYIGPLSGEVVAEVPFKLAHPTPGTQAAVESRKALKRQASRIVVDSSDEDIIFEDFTKLRPSLSIDE